MKKVLILFTQGQDITEKFFFSDTKYQKCYEYLYTLAEQKGVKLFRAPMEWYNQSEKIFIKAWTYENGEWIIAENISPDLIYDKTKFSYAEHLFKEALSQNYPILNDIEFTLLLSNKHFTGIIFPRFCKTYYRVDNASQMSETLEKIPGKMVVLKPAVGSGGHGVEVMTKTEALKKELQSSLLVQEFVDSSHGIPDVVVGMHDLRLVFINDNLIYSYIRQPAKGSYLANIAQGGSMFVVEKNQLPLATFEVIDYVQGKLASFPQKVFTIDLIFDADGRPWIVELNSMPGVYFQPQEKEQQDRMYGSLIELFKGTS